MLIGIMLDEGDSYIDRFITTQIYNNKGTVWAAPGGAEERPNQSVRKNSNNLFPSRQDQSSSHWEQIFNTTHLIITRLFCRYCWLQIFKLGGRRRKRRRIKKSWSRKRQWRSCSERSTWACRWWTAPGYLLQTFSGQKWCILSSESTLLRDLNI